MSVNTKAALNTVLKMDGVFSFLAQKAILAANNIRVNRLYQKQIQDLSSNVRVFKNSLDKEAYSIFSVNSSHRNLGMNSLQYYSNYTSRQMSLFYNCDCDYYRFFGPQSNSISLSMGDSGNSRIDILWVSYFFSCFGPVLVNFCDSFEKYYFIGQNEEFEKILNIEDIENTIDSKMSLLDLVAMNFLSSFDYVQLIHMLNPVQSIMQQKGRSLQQVAGVTEDQLIELNNIWHPGNPTLLDDLMGELLDSRPFNDVFNLPDPFFENPVLISQGNEKKWIQSV